LLFSPLNLGKSGHAGRLAMETIPLISSRAVARGNGWHIDHVICRSGPQNDSYEERHERVSIAAVVRGSFGYRCDAGRSLMHPGSLMLGNAGSCFECGHEHGAGDVCVAVHLDQSLFEEISASSAGTSKFRFGLPSLSASNDLLQSLVELEALTIGARHLAAEQLVIGLSERVGRQLSGSSGRVVKLKPGDERRVSRVVRFIDENSSRSLDLEELADQACLSKYHFSRVFRRATGATPYGYVLGVRLKRAAVSLATTTLPVASIALEAGFGDLSTFNRRFREMFGKAPGAFRRGA
jgi:AraC family transcriptional regulator